MAKLKIYWRPSGDQDGPNPPFHAHYRQCRNSFLGMNFSTLCERYWMSDVNFHKPSPYPPDTKHCCVSCMAQLLRMGHPMAREFKTSVYFYDESADGKEVEYVAECNVTPGYAGRGPDLKQPGEPPEPPEVEIGDVKFVETIWPGRWPTFKRRVRDLWEAVRYWRPVRWTRMRPRFIEHEIAQELQDNLVDRHGEQIKEGALTQAEESWEGEEAERGDMEYERMRDERGEREDRAYDKWRDGE
jgi:hypothetical protein